MSAFTIEDYSDRAIAVFCGSKGEHSYHYFLTDKLGGKFNEALRPVDASNVRRAGYIFGKKRRAEVEKELAAEQKRLNNGGQMFVPSSTQSSSASSSTTAPTVSSSSTSMNEKVLCNLVAKMDALEAELAAIRSLIEAGGIDVSKLSLTSSTSKQPSQPKKKAKLQVETSDEDDGEQKGEEDMPSLIKRKQNKQN